MALPSPYYIACFPLQEYFVDKDTGFPLAAGRIEFYSDPQYTVPKDVFIQSYNPNNDTYTYVNVGSVVTLSSVGTPQYLGTDFIPFLLPFKTINPDGSPGAQELYFVKVVSSNNVLQFTRAGWPPNIAGESVEANTFQGSANILTNSQFSSVVFNVDPATNKFTSTVNGANVVLPIGPGWDLVATSGAPSVVNLSRVEVIGPIYGEPAYAIRVQTDASMSSVKLRQRLYNSPTLLFGQNVSTFLQARSIGASNQPINMYYRPSDPTATSYLILDGVTTGAGTWTGLYNTTPDAQAVYINNQANNTGSGYIDIEIELPVNQVIEITAVQIVTVDDSDSAILYIPQSTSENTNTTYWYDKPNLEYKPIPSYTLGWNWPINPCQELGPTINAVANNPGLSRYVADETIVFQNTNSAFACAFNSSGMVVNNAVDTSFAIVKYFEGALAREILSTSLCVQLKAGGAIASTDDVVANVSVWWTSDATLPDMRTNSYSLISSVDNTTGVATIGGGAHGTWTELPRGNLGKAAVSLKTANPAITNFTGWLQADTTPSTTATYCAIVISVSKLKAGVSCTFEYCTLNAGAIPTRPQATSFGENLLGLQQFYEKSYNFGVLPSAVTTTGATTFAQATVAGSTIAADTRYKINKRSAPTAGTNLIIYSTTGAAAKVRDGSAGDMAVTGYDSGESGFWIIYDSVVTPPATSNQGHSIFYQWVANARLGIQL